MYMKRLLYVVILLVGTGIGIQSAVAQDIVAMVKRVKPAVVTVVSYNSFDLEDGQGSGFFIDQNKVVTNYHVIEGSSSIKIRMNDSAEFVARHIILQDSALDVAILAIDMPASRKVTPIPFRAKLPEQGERIYVVGNPLGLEQSVTDGIVSSVRELKHYGKVIQFTAGISPGNSGSPLLDANGMALGVARLALSEGQNLNFAVPADKITSLKAGEPIPFAPTVKQYDGKEMSVKDAFVVDTALIGIPPKELSQKEQNIWRLKNAAARAKWDKEIIDQNINRIVRAVRRNYEKMDIEKDTLTMRQAEAVIYEALGENSAANELSPENTAKVAGINKWLEVLAVRTALSGEVKPIGAVSEIITTKHQKWLELTKDEDYYIISAADSSDIGDIDVAVFQSDSGSWKPIASSTQKDWYCSTAFTAPETGEYAVIWRVAQYVVGKKEGAFGAIILRRR